MAFVLGAAVAAAMAWLWVCWCVFPVSVWNDVRLAPAFAIAHGMPLYPGEHGGAVSTWIYGPLPLLLLWPATLAASAAHALQIAGAINLLMTTAAIATVCAAWPSPAGSRLTASDRILATVLAIGVWPRASLQYLQADNAAVALGLIGNLLLVRARNRTWLWGAAFCAAACLACKQTSLGVAAAQVVWLGITGGRAAALRHLGRCVAVGMVVAGILVLGFDWHALRLNLLDLPARLPWAANQLDRFLFLAPELSVHLIVPALVMLVGRRLVWERQSVLLLPSLAWLCALPLGLAALMKTGGAINSLQSFAYWLPPALLVALAAARAHRRATLMFAGAALAGFAVCTVRLARVPAHPWQPLVEHYRQAEILAHSFRNEIWFPWNPLVTFYGEGRFYHVEDGLYARFLTGHALTFSHARAGLPPAMCVIALPRGGSDYGIALGFRPARAQRAEFGLWTLYSWPPEEPAGRPAPVPQR
jgi:hypothetical protein